MEPSRAHLPILDSLSGEAPAEANLLGFTEEQMSALLEDQGEKAFRGRQVFQNIFARGIEGFEHFTDLSKDLRHRLSERYSLSAPRVDRCEVSEDGTRKYRFVSMDGLAFEAVYIPSVAKSGKTNTLCVSSQTGCAVGCKFCYTASIRRNRNLAAHEIVGQVLAVQRDLEALQVGRITNIVFMGMGEPLLNYAEVVQSIRVLLERKGLDFSTRRITVSTAGIVPRIYDLGQDLGTQLAISLNATTNEVRNRVMPINKKWPIEDLVAAMRAYPLKNRRRITVEYVLLKDINDTDADAQRLVKLLRDIPTKINLLPLNEHDRTEFSRPSDQRVRAFQNILLSKHMNAIPRAARGRDISAACGQLGGSVGA